jgi:HEAT repeat protein
MQPSGRLLWTLAIASAVMLSLGLALLWWAQDKAEPTGDATEAARRETERKLARMGPGKDPAIGEFIERLKSPDKEVRTASARALQAISAVLVRRLGEEDPQVRRQATITLAAIGKPAVPALTAALKNRDNRLRLDATLALAGIGQDAADALTIALSDRDAGVRQAAAFGLRPLGAGARKAVDSLAAALKDPEPIVRRRAAESLGLLGATARPSLPALREALGDGDASVRREAAAALARINPDT